LLRELSGIASISAWEVSFKRYDDLECLLSSLVVGPVALVYLDRAKEAVSTLMSSLLLRPLAFDRDLEDLVDLWSKSLMSLTFWIKIGYYERFEFIEQF
jgi:hypothetical protein